MRAIDPSKLEGDDLFNWYRRSPEEVEADREAARQERYDTFVGSIGRASGPQAGLVARPPEAGEDPVPSRAEEVGPTGQGAGFIRARFLRPPSPSVMAPPSGPRIGPPVDARGRAPVSAPRPGFFDAHSYLDSLGGYFTDLPGPLNVVTATPTHWWMLGDGRLATQDEVERIYAEQKRRLKGQDDAEPASRLRVVDKWKDGQIPRAQQVEKGERELDPTCAPNGGWERDPNFERYAEHTKRYEAQITHAPGLDYVVRNPGQRSVKFDGCAVWDRKRQLLEAKGPGYAQLLPKARQWKFYEGMARKAGDQAMRQRRAAPRQRIECHVAEPAAFAFFQEATRAKRSRVVLQQTRAR